VAVISFGLGRLSKIREEKTPITIEKVKENTETGESKPLSTSNVDSGTNGAGIMLQHNSSTISNFPSSSKIFVASRNGKKYYYNTEGILIKTEVFVNGKVAEIIR